MITKSKQADDVVSLFCRARLESAENEGEQRGNGKGDQQALNHG